MKNSHNTGGLNLDDFFEHYEESFYKNHPYAGRDGRFRRPALKQVAVL